MAKFGFGGSPADAFKEAGFGARNTATDTEHEAKAVNRGEGFGRKGAGAGDNARLNELAKDQIIGQAISDKLAMQAGMHPSQQAQDTGGDFSAEYNAAQEARAALMAQDTDKDGAGGEEEDELEKIRNARRKQMKERQQKLIEYKEKGHGSYEEIVEEEFLKTVTSSQRCLVHFYHRQFEKCKVMDMHLKRMAPKFMGTKMVSLNAEKAPFFVQKLAVKTLPTVVLFLNGVAIYKQLGFELLGADHDGVFKTARFCRLLQEFEGLEEDFESDDENLQ